MLREWTLDVFSLLLKWRPDTDCPQCSFGELQKMSFHWSHLQNSFRLQSLIYSFKFNVKRPGDADTELPVFTGYKHTESTLVYVVFYLILSVLAFRYLLNPWLVYITYVQQKARGSNLAHHLMLCGLESSTCMCVFFFFIKLYSIGVMLVFVLLKKKVVAICSNSIFSALVLYNYRWTVCLLSDWPCDLMPSTFNLDFWWLNWYWNHLT